MRDAYADVGAAMRVACERALGERLTTKQYRVFLAVLHSTASWSRLSDTVSVEQIAETAGLHRRDVRRALGELSDRDAIVYQPGASPKGGKRVPSVVGLPRPADQGAGVPPSGATDQGAGAPPSPDQTRGRGDTRPGGGDAPAPGGGSAPPSEESSREEPPEGRAGGIDQPQTRASGTAQMDPPSADTPDASLGGIRPPGEAQPPSPDVPLWDEIVGGLPGPIQRDVLSAPEAVLVKLRNALRAAAAAGATPARIRTVWDHPTALAETDHPAGALAHRISRFTEALAQEVTRQPRPLPDLDAPRCPTCDGRPADPGFHPGGRCPLAAEDEERAQQSQDVQH